MVGGAAALPRGVGQREGGLVVVAERFPELGRAGLYGHGGRLAPVFAQRPCLLPPSRGQAVDRCPVAHARASSRAVRADRPSSGLTPTCPRHV